MIKEGVSIDKKERCASIWSHSLAICITFLQTWQNCTVMGVILWTGIWYFLHWILRDVGQMLCFLIKFTAVNSLKLSSVWPCETERNNEEERCFSSSSLNRGDLCSWEQPLLFKTVLSTTYVWIAYLQLDLRCKGTSMPGFLEKGLSVRLGRTLEILVLINFSRFRKVGWETPDTQEYLLHRRPASP